MGCNYCKKKGYQKINYLAPSEKEIPIKDYHSENDKHLELIETKYNFFNYVQLVEYVNLLEEFSLETLTVVTDEPMRTNFNYNDPFLTTEISLEEFQSFIQNKIFNLEELYEMKSNNQEITKIFLELFTGIYKALEIQLEKNKVPIYKRNLLAIGILFCSCENIEKIKLLFDVFQSAENVFYKSENLDNFLISLFLISSYCIINARKNIVNKELNIEEIPKDDLNELMKICGLENCQNLLNKFNKNFFHKEEGYNWEQFKKKFEDIENGFGWVVSSKGIRRKLEENIR